MERSDEVLITAHLHGDDTAFGELLRRHADSVYGFLLRMTRSPHDAEDLFQETFLRVHLKAGSFRHGAPFRPWLFAIAAHAAVDRLRKATRRPDVSTANGVDECPDDGGSDGRATSGPDPGAAMERDERRAEVRRALDALPAQQRAVVVLSYFEDMRYEEISAVLKCSVGTVKTHMSRAVRALADLLRKADFARNPVVPWPPGGACHGGTRIGR